MSGITKRGPIMPVRGNDNALDKAQEDNVKLLIALERALGRALGTHAKTPTRVQAVGVGNLTN
jgi:hypothetical protein